jgi:hemerythrin-like domain-containing protein
MDLVNRLKKEHTVILKTLGKMEDIGIFNKDSFKLLITSRKMLEAHLNTEDDQLYPLLKSKYADNEPMLKMIQGFINEMAEATLFIENFYEKYHSPDSNDNEFRLDFMEVLSLLSKRIEKEENELFALFK